MRKEPIPLHELTRKGAPATRLAAGADRVGALLLGSEKPFRSTDAALEVACDAEVEEGDRETRVGPPLLLSIPLTGRSLGSFAGLSVLSFVSLAWWIAMPFSAFFLSCLLSFAGLMGTAVITRAARRRLRREEEVLQRRSLPHQVWPELLHWKRGDRIVVQKSRAICRAQETAQNLKLMVHQRNFFGGGFESNLQVHQAAKVAETARREAEGHLAAGTYSFESVDDSGQLFLEDERGALSLLDLHAGSEWVSNTSLEERWEENEQKWLRERASRSNYMEFLEVVREEATRLAETGPETDSESNSSPRNNSSSAHA